MTDQPHSSENVNPGPSPANAPKFDPAAAHQNKPRIRQVRAFPARAGEQMLMGLADARQISEKVVVVAPAVQHLIPHMDGTKTLDQIVGAFTGKGLTRAMLEQLVAQLDDAGLLEGPAFEAMLAKVKADFDGAAVLPPAGSAAFAEALVAQELKAQPSEEQLAELGPAKMRAVFDAWMDKAVEGKPDPSFDALPKAVVAPHLDYARGWMNYAAVYARMRVVDRPARVVILGTNHFGVSTGVCGCDKGYETPLGVSKADTGLIGRLRESLGDALFANRYDHEREHSVELQVSWVQHVFGKDEHGEYPLVFGALVHDPCVRNGESYDGKGVSLQAFTAALREAIAAQAGATLVISSADLSHVGPAFGDQVRLADMEDEKAKEFRDKVFGHDREMLELIADNKVSEAIAAMSWQQNPTRWCSLGNIAAAAMTVGAERVRLVNYAAAMDQAGSTMVSSAAMVME